MKQRSDTEGNDAMERVMHEVAQGTGSRRARRVAGVAALLVGLVGAAGAPASAQQTSGVYAFRSGVWLDAERERAYLMQPAAGVEAIDLRTGKTLWRQSQIEKPLWASRDRLLAQRMESADEISLVMLDVAAYGAPGSVGEFGWAGAAKTYYWVDPAEELVGVFMTQYMTGPELPDRTFRAVVYQAIDD